MCKNIQRGTETELNDKINCRVLVLVSGVPLFHVMESVGVIAASCWGSSTGGTSGGYMELGSSVCTWDLFHIFCFSANLSQICL